MCSYVDNREQRFKYFPDSPILMEAKTALRDAFGRAVTLVRKHSGQAVTLVRNPETIRMVAIVATTAVLALAITLSFM